jgi:hypothetical protein
VNIEICPREVFVKLLCFICILLFLNILGIISKLYFHNGFAYGLIPLFNFDAEGNIPALYSSLSLLFASILLSIIGISHKRNSSAYLYWYGLAFIFLFLSIDEAMAIHEPLGRIIRGLLHTSGLLYLAWVIPYGIALMIVFIVYLKFLKRLPKNTMILFVVSGTIFVGSAIGFELLGGRYLELHGSNNLMYSLLYTCEEFLEMLGIVIFIYSLLSYIVSQFKSLTIRVIEPEQK